MKFLINVIIIIFLVQVSKEDKNYEDFQKDMDFHNFLNDYMKTIQEQQILKNEIRFRRNVDSNGENDESEEESTVECKNEGDIFEGYNLQSYSVCKKVDNVLIQETYDCENGTVYNATTGRCSPLLGNGDVVCVVPHRECPDDRRGIVPYPNETMYRNYVICLPNMVIVAECDNTTYFNVETKSCMKDKTVKNTIVDKIDCPDIPEIECSSPGIFPILFDEGKTTNCTNCYYLCNDKDRTTYDLSVICSEVESNVTELTHPSTITTLMNSHISYITTKPTLLTSSGIWTTDILTTEIPTVFTITDELLPSTKLQQLNITSKETGTSLESTTLSSTLITTSQKKEGIITTQIEQILTEPTAATETEIPSSSPEKAKELVTKSEDSKTTPQTKELSSISTGIVTTSEETSLATSESITTISKEGIITTQTESTLKLIEEKTTSSSIEKAKPLITKSQESKTTAQTMELSSKSTGIETTVKENTLSTSEFTITPVTEPIITLQTESTSQVIEEKTTPSSIEKAKPTTTRSEESKTTPQTTELSSIPTSKSTGEETIFTISETIITSSKEGIIITQPESTSQDIEEKTTTPSIEKAKPMTTSSKESKTTPQTTELSSIHTTIETTGEETTSQFIITSSKEGVTMTQPEPTSQITDEKTTLSSIEKAKPRTTMSEESKTTPQTTELPSPSTNIEATDEETTLPTSEFIITSSKEGIIITQPESTSQIPEENTSPSSIENAMPMTTKSEESNTTPGTIELSSIRTSIEATGEETTLPTSEFIITSSKEGIIITQPKSTSQDIEEKTTAPSIEKAKPMTTTNEESKTTPQTTELSSIHTSIETTGDETTSQFIITSSKEGVTITQPEPTSQITDEKTTPSSIEKAKPLTTMSEESKTTPQTMELSSKSTGIETTVKENTLSTSEITITPVTEPIITPQTEFTSQVIEEKTTPSSIEKAKPMTTKSEESKTTPGTTELSSRRTSIETTGKETISDFSITSSKEGVTITQPEPTSEFTEENTTPSSIEKAKPLTQTNEQTEVTSKDSKQPPDSIRTDATVTIATTTPLIRKSASDEEILKASTITMPFTKATFLYSTIITKSEDTELLSTGSTKTFESSEQTNKKGTTSISEHITTSKEGIITIETDAGFIGSTSKPTEEIIASSTKKTETKVTKPVESNTISTGGASSTDKEVAYEDKTIPTSGFILTTPKEGLITIQTESTLKITEQTTTISSIEKAKPMTQTTEQLQVITAEFEKTTETISTKSSIDVSATQPLEHITSTTKASSTKETEETKTEYEQTERSSTEYEKALESNERITTTTKAPSTKETEETKTEYEQTEKTSTEYEKVLESNERITSTTKAPSTKETEETKTGYEQTERTFTEYEKALESNEHITSTTKAPSTKETEETKTGYQQTERTSTEYEKPLESNGMETTVEKDSSSRSNEGITTTQGEPGSTGFTSKPTEKSHPSSTEEAKAMTTKTEESITSRKEAGQTSKSTDIERPVKETTTPTSESIKTTPKETSSITDAGILSTRYFPKIHTSIQPTLKPPRKIDKKCQFKEIPGHRCTEEGFFRVNTSCTKYYECSFSKECNKLMQSTIYNCPKCLKFNAKNQLCDVPENVPECTYLYISQHPHFMIKHHKKQDFCTGTGRYFIPDDCQKYYECESKSPGSIISLSVKRCPRYTNFDEKRRACIKGQPCRDIKPACRKDGYVPDKYDCSKFYHCYNNIAIPLICPLNYIYNGKYCQLKKTYSLCDWQKLKELLHNHKYP